MKTIILLFTIMAMSHSVFSQAYPDRHNTDSGEAWVSCDTQDSPNPKRDIGHWIMYDLGDQYSLHESTIWNNNVPGQTDRGLNEVVIDISNDGEEWIELGIFNLVQGPGSSYYSGDEGPDFNGEIARYVLISALSNHGGDCYSLSEVKINAAITTTTSYAENELPVEMEVSPNPASQATTVKINELPDGNTKYQVIGTDGKLYRTGLIQNTETTIQLSDMPSGSYTITLYNEQGVKSELLTIISK